MQTFQTPTQHEAKKTSNRAVFKIWHTRCINSGCKAMTLKRNKEKVMKNAKENKMVRMAKLAQELGYTHIATVVKSIFSTTYHNVNSCKSIIETGRWAGSFRAHQFNGQHMGINGNVIDWGKTISRTSISRKLDELEK